MFEDEYNDPMDDGRMDYDRWEDEQVAQDMQYEEDDYDAEEYDDPMSYDDDIDEDYYGDYGE